MTSDELTVDQIVFSDDVDKTARIISSYFLHVDPLSDGKLDLMERLSMMLSMTPEEVLAGRDLETGDSKESCGVNPARFTPRMLEEVVLFDLQHPAYKDWAARIWNDYISLPYDKIDSHKRDIR